jgi:hypothetical protein
MEKLLINVCVVFILPNKKQLDFRVRSRKIKPRPPAGGDGCEWDLRAERRSTLWSGMWVRSAAISGEGNIKRELQN